MQWLITETVLTLARINLWAWADNSKIEFIDVPAVAFSRVLINLFVIYRIGNSTMDEFQETADPINKVFEYSLAPCDKVATLYVMQQKMDSPIYNIPE